MPLNGLCECGCGQLAPISTVSHAKRGYIKGQPKRFVHQHHTRGKLNGRWNGGRRIDKSGYVLIMAAKHLRADSHGYVREHILVLEKAFKRPILPMESIHHINGDRADNSIGNLILFTTNGMHIRFHARLRAFGACGHYDWRQCRFCHQYDDPNNMIIRGSAHHKKCHTEYERKRRAKG